ncbi:MAG: DUF3168 domain-containing protein [Rhodobiaceae bacterium]|nr:DUF3168 domain-containing protein [Rhodobiaceae bacterium]MCC0055914.1 DUF3168 domain-containing protein [Rhodobiaceae bacterium]
MEEALIAFLLADSGLTALVGTRVSYAVNQQGAPLPRVTILPVSRVPGYADDGEAGLTEARLQIDIYASSLAAAREIAAAVFARLSAVSAVISGVDFQTIELLDEDASFEALTDGDQPYRVRQDYLIWHNA